MDLSVFILVLNVVFILLSAFFSASETALFSIRPERMIFFRNHSSRSYRLVDSLLCDAHKTLLLILLGNIFVNITLTGLIFSYMQILFPRDATLLSLVIATVVIVLFGEILPKNIALRFNEQVSVLVAPLFFKLGELITPLLDFIHTINQIFLRQVKERMRKPSPFVTIEELEYGIDLSVQKGGVSEDEQKLIKGILEEGAEPVRKYMTHRSMVTVLEPQKPVGQAVRELLELSHTYALVSDPYERQRLRGFVHLSDLVKKTAATTVVNHCSEIIWVHDTIAIAELLSFMLDKNVSEVCVLDEFGGFSGVYSITAGLKKMLALSLPGQKKVVGKQNRAMHFDGLQEMELFEDWLPQSLKVYQDNYRTLNGLLCRYLGRIPQTGEFFEIDGWGFYISEASPTRIKSVFVKKSD